MIFIPSLSASSLFTYFGWPLSNQRLYLLSVYGFSQIYTHNLSLSYKLQIHVICL
jgi:hypothetical protein